jgi:1-acyl-sn-glycerol-3-phosphate acyltransferase
MLWLCGVRVTVIGECVDTRPLLVVSNHLSYLDIPILGSVVDMRFVPKKEVASWPIIGFICKIIDAVFVDRNVKKIGEGQKALRAALSVGEVVALFPEATTGDGRHMLPFKPAFFEAAAGVMIQPVAICYRKICGLPIDYGQWSLIAWYGDMLLLPHLWHLLSLGNIDVELHFLPPISSLGMDRKSLAAAAQEAITSCQLSVNS